jgi:hypothetical protein
VLDAASLDAGGSLDSGAVDAGGVLDAGRDAGTSFDAGHDAGTSFDAGRDAGFDAGRDAGFDAGRDAGLDAGPLRDGGTSATFPTMAATTCYASGGGCSPLGAGGGGVHYVSGDYLEETIALTGPSISQLRLTFDMDDMTGGCALGPPPEVSTFDVLVNGTRVGSYSFTTGATPTGRLTVNQTYSFSSVTATLGNQYTVRLQATSTVCGGGSSWNWFPGGTATGVSP